MSRKACFLWVGACFFEWVTVNSHLDACATINELATQQKFCPLKKQALRTLKHVTLRHLHRHCARVNKTVNFIFQISEGNTPFLMRRYAWSRRRETALRKTCSEHAEGPRLRKNGNGSIFPGGMSKEVRKIFRDHIISGCSKIFKTTFFRTFVIFSMLSCI